MGSCNSGDHTAEDNTHTDITTCYIEKQQQKYRLGTVSNRWGGGVICLTGSKPSPLASAMFRNIWTA